MIKFIAGKKTAFVTLLLGIFVAGLFFGPLKASTAATNPGVGLPASAESVKADKLIAKLPGSDSSAFLVVYSSETKFTADQLKWLQGTFNPQAKMLTGGVNEQFTKFSNLKVMGKAFVPPASVSKNGKVAVVTVPVVKSDSTELITSRVADARKVAKSGLPAGVTAYVTGPEGFQADIAGVFAGADFKLLMATVIVVALLLLITYRSPVLWLIPLLVVGTADGVSGQAARQVLGLFGIVPDGSGTGILSVLVFGAGTNYALLLISRYREELLLNQDRHDAMRKAVREAGPAIIASGSTVTLALLSLSFANPEGTRSLGLACATGVVVAMISALTALPAALVIFGRGIFWPLVPRFGGVNKAQQGFWNKLAKGVSVRPTIVSIVGVIVLAALALGAANIKIGLSSTERFLKSPEAVTGQEVLAKAFPAGESTPTVVVSKATKATDVATALKAVPGVASTTVAGTGSGLSKINVVLDAGSGTAASEATLDKIRTAAHGVAGADALVGGLDAQQQEVKQAYAHDQSLVIPLILLLVFVVLILLLRSLVAPVLLLATVVGSFFASMGAGWLVFVNVLHFAALDLSVFLYSFLFLVALGVDYNIFLVTRAKEEAASHGVRQGMIRAVSATGGVITGAGILLAAVFAVLGVLPLVALAQIGVIVCIGVLLDTLLVRTVIVPALAFLTGKKFFWPNAKVAGE
jgi:putative drug exporter of the RND superfamily